MKFWKGILKLPRTIKFKPRKLHANIVATNLFANSIKLQKIVIDIFQTLTKTPFWRR